MARLIKEAKEFLYDSKKKKKKRKKKKKKEREKDKKRKKILYGPKKE